MNPTDYFFWQSAASWDESVRLAAGVIEQWNALTPFIQNHDQREKLWTVRHASSNAPFLSIGENKLRGTVPRIGDPLAALLMLTLARLHPQAYSMSLADGKSIDAAQLRPEDLPTVLPQAQHPVFQKLLRHAKPVPAPTPPAAKS